MKSQSDLAHRQISTPIGVMNAVATEKGICFLGFQDEKSLRDCKSVSGNTSHKTPASEHLRKLKKELDAYFQGKLKSFSVPLDMEGTAFQKKVWRQLLKIPYGETWSYRRQALAVKNPKAVRAVAQANRRNPVAIVVPCHRVIGSDGRLTGYGGGLWRKEFLLNLEKNR